MCRSQASAKSPVAALLCLAALPSCVSTERAFPPVDALYREALADFDDDRDGLLSRAEVERRDGRPGVFDALDVDRSGWVDAAELRRFTETTEPRGRSYAGGPPPPLPDGP